MTDDGMAKVGGYRKDGPDTMIEGALGIAPKLPTLRRRVYDLYNQHGEMTDHELVVAFTKAWGRCEPRSIGMRRHELVNGGYLEDTTRRRKHPASGFNNIIWRRTSKELP